MKTTKPLRLDLPIDVWERLAAEAAGKGVSIGMHAKHLFIARDKRMLDKRVSGNVVEPEGIKHTN